MKVRDCVAFSRRVRTRLLAKRCRVLGEPDDSRIAIHELHAVLAIPRGFDHEFGPHGSYAPAVQLDSWLCARTIEIQDVIVERMLAAKFVSCEISVP